MVVEFGLHEAERVPIIAIPRGVTLFSGVTLVSPGTQKENGGYVITYRYLCVRGVYLHVSGRCDNDEESPR